MVFSLIIPFYNTSRVNRSKMLAELIESLPDRDDLEVVLVDDHSEIPFSVDRGFRKTRILQEKNEAGKKFAGAARNHGIQLSSGNIVFFADSDDLFCTDSLNLVLDEIKRDGKHDVYIARSVSFVSSSKSGTRHLYMNKAIDNFKKSKNTDDLIPHHTPVSKFIKYSFIAQNDINFGEGVVGEDAIFNVKIMLKSPQVRIFDEMIYKIREGNDSLTGDESKSAIRARIESAREIQNMLKKCGKSKLREPLAGKLLRAYRAHPLVGIEQFVISALTGAKLVSSKRRVICNFVKR